MNILITGAGGQLGRTFRDVSADGKHKCFFTDMREGEGIMSLDVADLEAVMSVLEASDADVIVNCAAYTNVDGAELDEETAYKVNAVAPGVLAEAARRKGATLIHISTDYVFDGKSYRPYTEEDAPAPVSVYGRTKLEGEKAVVASGCKYVIFRTAWLYSRYGRNFFLTMADKTAELPVIKVVEDQIGTPTYALDLAELIYNIIDDQMLDRTGIYHFTDEGVCSWYDFAKAICDGLGHLCDVVPCRTVDYQTRAVRPHYSVLDKTKVRETFGIDIPHWRDSLACCIQDTF